MKFEIPFKAETYLKQVELTIPFIYKHHLKDTREALIVALTSLFIGIVINIGKSNFGNIFIILGVWFIIKSYQKYILYKTSKKIFLKIAKKELSKNQSDYRNGIFEFTEDTLRYNDTLKTIDSTWNEFESFKIVSANLLLILDEKKGEIIVIGENEVGNKNFEKIIKFVERKLN